ncbi:MAG: hypothetical protein K2H96_04620 [Muribaculaceae bacterium]|nr:hypothetical protein [Muribaculaceae bacterium]
MLGIKQNIKPIEGQDAERIRQAALRVALGKPSEEELRAIKHLKAVRQKYNVIWK